MDNVKVERLNIISDLIDQNYDAALTRIKTIPKNERVAIMQDVRDFFTSADTRELGEPVWNALVMRVFKEL